MFRVYVQFRYCTYLTYFLSVTTCLFSPLPIYEYIEKNESSDAK